MKKRMKRITALAMTGLLVAGCLTACGPKEKAGEHNSAKDIEINYWQAGLGREWLDNIVAAFEEKYPEYNVHINASASNASVIAPFGLETEDTVDLYLATTNRQTEYMEPLNDILEEIADGDTKPLKEKFNQEYLEMEKFGDNYYHLTYGGGNIGFVYNKALFEQAGIKQVPRTTDELALTCSTLNDNSIKPLIHFKTAGYYHFTDQVWFAQYNGYDSWRDFYINPTKDKMMEKDGRYEVLKVHEKLNTGENVVVGSNSENAINMQTKFLEGQAAIMVTGSWLENEMRYQGKMNDFAMMKTPVISSIVDKLTTVKKDKDLRNLVTAIDKVTDGEVNIDTYKDGENYKIDNLVVSAADWEYVKAARAMTANNYAGETCFIPNYSNAKEGAKKFLQFLFSDEGYKIYADTIHLGMPLSLSEGTIDTSKWSEFAQNQFRILSETENGIYNSFTGAHELFFTGGGDAFAHITYVNKMCTMYEDDRQTADDIWKTITQTIDERYDNTWMKNIK